MAGLPNRTTRFISCCVATLSSEERVGDRRLRR